MHIMAPFWRLVPVMTLKTFKNAEIRDKVLFDSTAEFRFLAHLSLQAHWWVSSIAMVRRPSVVHHFQRSSSPKPLGLSKPNFIWSLSGMGERKFVRGIWVTWPRWPPRPYMVKARSNLVPYTFIWGKTVRKSFNGRNLQQMTIVTEGLC